MDIIFSLYIKAKIRKRNCDKIFSYVSKVMTSKKVLLTT